ncbi:MAG: PAS domain S-box protein, partial [Candidatus Magasanikbacteria bacterium]|nr:PAS domain S-box protein [Candidatus Magasanikbacteria bacterium]
MFSFPKTSNSTAAEERVQKLNILLKAISRVNQLIVKEKNRIVIFQKLCEYLISTGLFSLVWVGLKVEGNFDVRPVAKAGKSTGYLDEVKITWDEKPTGAGPTGLAIKTRLPQNIQDFTANSRFKAWLEQAKRYDLKSSMALPLVVDGEVIGALNVYSSEVNAFGVDEINLLVEVSEDVGFALQSLENEEKLIKSENRYRVLAEAAHDMIYMFSKDFKIEFVNSYTTRHFKQDSTSLIGKPFVEFFSSEAAERHKKNLEKVLVTGESLYVEAEEDMGGKKLFLGSWLCPVFDETGKAVSVLGISRDISARKLMELQLKQSEANYKNLVDLSPDALVVHSGGKILFLNQAALKMLGADDPQKIIGQPVMN